MTTPEGVFSTPQGQSPPSSCDTPAPQSHQIESLKKAIRWTESELEGEYRSYCGQVNAGGGEGNLEVMRLKEELNKQTTVCAKKSGYLTRLKVLSDYPRETIAFTPEEVADGTAFANSSALQTQIVKLQTRLESALRKIVEEEQTTEALKMMHEKVMQAETIMKQRTCEVQQVLERISNQLRQAKRMRQIADNFCTLASNETLQTREGMTCSREGFKDKVRRKTADRDEMQRAKTQVMERMGMAALRKCEFHKRKLLFIQSLDGELQRHIEEKQRLIRANRDITDFVSGFKVIAEVLQAHGSIIAYNHGLSEETVIAITHQFNLMLMMESSLASRYNHLTWEYSEKEAYLQTLRQRLASRESLYQEDDRKQETGYDRKLSSEVADNMEQLSLRIYTGMIILMSQIDFVHERVSDQLPDPESPDHVSWATIKILTKGYRQKHRERASSGTSREPISREATRRSSFRSRTSSLTRKKFPVIDLRDAKESESWSSIYGTLITPSDISNAISDIGISLNVTVKAQLDMFLNRTPVVKYFMDVPIFKEFLRNAKAQMEPKLEFLLEKCHFALKTGFKNLTTFAKEALQSFLLTGGRCQEQATEFYRKRMHGDQPDPHPAESDHRILKKQKEILRSRVSKLFPAAIVDESFTDSQKLPPPPSDTKRSSLPDTSKKTATPLDEEALEAMHVVELRLQLKSGKQGTAIKRTEGNASAGRAKRLHEMDDPPTTERAKMLLKDFLTTERKISAVRDRERLTFKAQSARTTPTVRQLSWARLSTPSRIRIGSRLLRQSLPQDTPLQPTHRHTASQTFKTALML